MIKADIHTHTLASHGSGTVPEMYDAAQKKGLEYIGFSEHSPLPDGFFCSLYTGDLEHEFLPYTEAVLELPANQKTRPLLGVELDWIPSRLDWMRNLINSAPFDYILASLHQVDGFSVGNIKNWPPELDLQEKYARFSAYYAEMANVARSGLAHAITHPDFIKLRAFAEFQQWLKLPQSQELILDTLLVLARHDVLMEVNSAGLRWPFQEPYPGPLIMALARKAGVKIFLGSDAHSPEHVAFGLEKLENYVRGFGFNKYHIVIRGEKIAFELN